MQLHYIHTSEAAACCDRFVLYFSPEYVSAFSTPETSLLFCFIHKSDSPILLKPSKSRLHEFLGPLSQMEETYHLPDNGLYGKELYLKALLCQFLLLTNQLYFEQNHVKITKAHHIHSHLMGEICKYIGKHYGEKLDTEIIAKEFSVSQTLLYHIFREISGMTVSEYLTEYRISKAKDLLINSDYSVEIISQTVGYENLSSFSRVFKQKASVSPNQYRKKYQG